MRTKAFNDASVDLAVGLEFSELKPHELRKPKFTIRKPVHPVSKFGNVFFLYRKPDLEFDEREVGIDNAGYIAVIE